jgi:dTDP-4-amino-4,6-dideoxygalactose transaminase
MSVALHREKLALDGGEPVRRTPMPRWPSASEDEIEAAVAVLRSGAINYWTGDEGRKFEREFAAACGCEHAIVLANGTVALELALWALGVGPGDEVIVPSKTFVATASAAVMRGAIPVIADVDPDSQNLTAQSVAAVLSSRTKAVIAVHFAGWPCDLDPLLELANQHGLKLIEDCAQAHGAKYKGRPVGGFGDVAAFSFCQDKIITTGGEGGMLTTNDRDLWERSWSYKDHGKSWDAVYHRPSNSIFKWLHESFGTNWRLTEMQSAIGRAALRRLDESVARRRDHAAVVQQELQSVPGLRIVVPPPEAFHSYYKYYAFVRPELLRPDWDRDRIVRAIQAEGIPCGSGGCSEIYREQAFVAAGLGPPQPLPVAQQLSDTSLMFLVHPTLEHGDILDSCRAVQKVLTAATAG